MENTFINSQNNSVNRINKIKNIVSYKDNYSQSERFNSSTRINNLKKGIFNIQKTSSDRTNIIRNKTIFSSYKNKSEIINGYLECCKSTPEITDLNTVLNHGNNAYQNIDMNNNTIENVTLNELLLNIDPTIPSTPIVTSQSIVPITLNGNTYYIQLFTL